MPMPKQNTSPMTSHYTVSSHSQTTLWIYGICDVSSTHMKWKRLNWCGRLLGPPPCSYSWLPGYPYLHPQSLCYLHPPPWSTTAADSSSRSGEGPGIPVKLRYHSGPSFRKAATGNKPSPETERPAAVKRHHVCVNALPIQSRQGLSKIMFRQWLCHHIVRSFTSDNTSWCHVMCKQQT